MTWGVKLKVVAVPSDTVFTVESADPSPASKTASLLKYTLSALSSPLLRPVALERSASIRLSPLSEVVPSPVTPIDRSCTSDPGAAGTTPETPTAAAVTSSRGATVTETVCVALENAVLPP